MQIASATITSSTRRARLMAIMSSERSAAHHCIQGKGRRLEYRSGQTLAASGYMCTSRYAYHLEPNGLQRQRWALQPRILSRMLPPLLYYVIDTSEARGVEFVIIVDGIEPRK